MRGHFQYWAIRTRTIVICLVSVLSLLSTLLVASVQAQGDTATPGAAGGAAGSLATMLGQLPALPLFDLADQEFAILSYADYATQLTAVDAAPPATMQDPFYDRWLQATRVMPPLVDGAYVYTPEWRPSFGFDAFQVDQSAQYRGGDLSLYLLRGRFDPAEVQTALGGSGYEPVTIDGDVFLSAGEDGEFDFASPAGSMTFGTMNNATILGDGTLVFSATRAGMRAVLATAGGRAPSLADQDDIAPLLRAVRPDLVTAWLTSGLGFSLSDPLANLPRPGATPNLDAFATEAAERSALPPLVTVLLGTTAGGPLPDLGQVSATPVAAPGMPIASAHLGLLLPNQDAAASAVPVLEERLETLRLEGTDSTLADRPYTELFPERDVTSSGDEPVVAIDLTLSDETPPDLLVDLWFQNDLDLLAWS